MADFSGLVFFKPGESNGRGGKAFLHPEKMSQELMEKLERVRKWAGIPLVITSDYREGDDKAHGRGTAVDIRCHTSRNRYKILDALYAYGFTRIGVYDKHIHADIDVDPSSPQRMTWVGTS